MRNIDSQRISSSCPSDPGLAQGTGSEGAQAAQQLEVAAQRACQHNHITVSKAPIRPSRCQTCTAHHQTSQRQHPGNIGSSKHSPSFHTAASNGGIINTSCNRLRKYSHRGATVLSHRRASSRCALFYGIYSHLDSLRRIGLQTAHWPPSAGTGTRKALTAAPAPMANGADASRCL